MNLRIGLVLIRIQETSEMGTYYIGTNSKVDFFNNSFLSLFSHGRNSNNFDQEKSGCLN